MLDFKKKVYFVPTNTLVYTLEQVDVSTFFVR